MTVRKTALVAGPAILLAIGAASVVLVRRHRARGLGAPRTAGSMFVGAVDEVELAGPLRGGQNPEAFDPEEVPSEHQQINDLRDKMPMG